MSCSKQKGGGVFDVFCPLCNLPFYSPFEGQKPPSDDDEDDELYDLRNTKLDWLSDVLGVDDNTHTVMELKGDDRYGQFPIKNGKEKGELFGLRDSIAVQAGTRKKEYYKGFGAAFHNDCVKYISEKSGRPINYQLGVDIEQTIEDYFKAHPKTRRDDDYQQQSYDFIQALEDNGPEYFVSPLEPDGKHVRQMLSDFIPNKKASSPSPPPPRDITPKKAASPKKAATPPPPTRDIFGYASPKAASPKKNGSPGAASSSCSSQKDKAICIKKKCVWGKTNRCSKKRSTRKKTKSKSKSTPTAHGCPSHKDKTECVMNNCVWGKTNRCSKKRVSK